jgi:hypothetical protein
VASFSDADIHSIVQAADLPDEGAAEEMARVLRARRDLIAKHWFGKVGPLDQFQVSMKSGLPEVTFSDWLHKGSWSENENVSYSWNLRHTLEDAAGQTKPGSNVIRPFENSVVWNAWLARTKKKKTKRYLQIRITPMKAEKWELPAHKPELRQVALAPATEAWFWLDDSDKLHWVGVARKP